MSTAFAATIRDRAYAAWQALQAARRDDDHYATLLAEGEWEDLRRLAHAHGVDIETGRPDTPEEGA
ncbi:hypothetical protein ACIBIZ_19940 [Nonomuraea spiralis]|uniref:Uncharacterized protein n=1 Tax=Nonomuraea spiralis TaxID=46182 RepID=A0ABV5I6X6_9ACTN|nr:MULTISPECIES: hypothetical protein [Nonomuraea]RSM95263.1 hypothetical protein DMB42_49980 [Nonomuraea sp. WAC 01424]GGS67204.1 hypothetical protein GCM10010176_007400 [Nonomuraea spiralis]